MDTPPNVPYPLPPNIRPPRPSTFNLLNERITRNNKKKKKCVNQVFYFLIRNEIHTRVDPKTLSEDYV